MNGSEEPRELQELRSKILELQDLLIQLRTKLYLEEKSLKRKGESVKAKTVHDQIISINEELRRIHIGKYKRYRPQ